MFAYSAVDDCHRGEQFAAAVAMRGRNVVTIADNSPTTMRVTIVSESSSGYRGTLQMSGLG